MGTGKKARLRVKKYFEAKGVNLKEPDGPPSHNRLSYKQSKEANLARDLQRLSIDRAGLDVRGRTADNEHIGSSKFYRCTFHKMIDRTLKHGFLVESQTMPVVDDDEDDNDDDMEDADGDKEMADADEEKETPPTKKFHSAWDDQTIRAIKKLLRFRGRFAQECSRLEAYFTHLFHACCDEKREHPGRFHTDGKVMLLEDWKAFMSGVKKRLNEAPMNAGGYKGAIGGIDIHVLFVIVDNVAKHRYDHRQANAPLDRSAMTRKQKELMQAADKWLDTFPDGRWKLLDLGFDSVGDEKPMQLSIRPVKSRHERE